jgi:hypothetical protein
MDLRSTLANLKYLLLYLTATTSAMLPPPPAHRRTRAEAIPMKKVLGVFDTSGGPGSSASSSINSGTGNGSFRAGIGRIFGTGGAV